VYSQLNVALLFLAVLVSNAFVGLQYYDIKSTVSLVLLFVGLINRV
jgi:hypothetical protein